MSKRFTDTNKFDDPWYCELSKDAKLAWEFILAKCDGAGVWEPNFKIAAAYLGEVDWKAVLAELGNRVIVLESGRWWAWKFVKFQYGELSEACKPHQGVIRLLKKHGLFERLLELQSKGLPDKSEELPKSIQRVSEELPKGCQTLQDKDKDKEKDKDKGLGSAEGKGEQNPQVTPPTLEQVKAIAANQGVPPDCAEMFWHDCDGAGWVDAKQRPIRNWRSALTAYATRWRANEFQRQRGRLGSGPPAPPNAKVAEAVSKLDRFRRQSRNTS